MFQSSRSTFWIVRRCMQNVPIHGMAGVFLPAAERVDPRAGFTRQDLLPVLMPGEGATAIAIVPPAERDDSVAGICFEVVRRFGRALRYGTNVTGGHPNQQARRYKPLCEIASHSRIAWRMAITGRW